MLNRLLNLMGALALLVAPACYAATVNTTCAGLQAAISAAAPGDTIVVPNGSCGSFTVANGVTVNGSGATSASGLTLSGNSRVTGFSFSATNGVSINVDLNTIPRFDHNTLSSTAQVIFININGIGRALLDHNSFTGGAASEMIHNLGAGASSTSGWSNDLQPGGPDMVFVEDNTFTFPASGSTAYFWGSSAIQSYYGARTVFRHNTLNMVQVDQHGTAGNIGARWWEIYNNTFVTVANANQSNYMAIRAGSGVIFNNTHTGGGNSGAGSIELVEEDSGYPALYQIGRGINQKLSPAYVWGNSSDMPVGSGSSNVVQGRDFFLSATQPATMTKAQAASDGNGVSYSYVPYPYPHPLQGGGGVITPPASPTNTTALPASTSVTLSWTASVTPGVTYNVKRSTVSGSGYSTLANVPGLTYTDTTVQPGSTYFYVVSANNSSGESVNSSQVSAMIPGTNPPGCSTVTANTWVNQPFSVQTGTFTASLDATPSGAVMDSLLGLSNGPASANTNLASIIWFNPSGVVQARNGANYAAVNTYRFTAGTAYHVTLTVNTTAHTYSAAVHTGTAPDTIIATNYAFRTEQATVAQLNNFAVFTNTGQPSLTACNFALGNAPPPPVSITIAPTTQTLLEGATQQFTSTVTGSTNTAATFSATGGVISITGLFTAGTTPGNFAVTATSVADPTKSATASVKITTPPPTLLMTCAGLTCILTPTNMPSGTQIPVSGSALGVTATGTAVVP